MKTQEYKEKLERLAKNYKLEQNLLAKKYAHSNNPYSDGDIITDHIGSGKIITWSTYIGVFPSLPCLIYECENLTKKGTINKREPRRKIYQSNIL